MLTMRAPIGVMGHSRRHMPALSVMLQSAGRGPRCLRVAQRSDNIKGADPSPTDSSAQEHEEAPSTSEKVNMKNEDYFGSEELVQELTDPKKFGSRGEAWFFAQLAVIALIVFPPMPLQGLVAFCGTLSLSAGIVFMLYALLSLGRNLSPLPQPRQKHSLVTSGMYSYVRHPMYAGSLMASFGFAAVTTSEVRLALAVLLWYILEKKIEYEEAMLSACYPEYEEYKAKVKKFIPFLY